jgi:hypothetical protein
MVVGSNILSNRPKRERRCCPVCRRSIAVDIAGRFFDHGAQPLCEGSGQLPRKTTIKPGKYKGNY